MRPIGATTAAVPMQNTSVTFVPAALRVVALDEHPLGEIAPEAELFGKRCGCTGTITRCIDERHGISL